MAVGATLLVTADLRMEARRCASPRKTWRRWRRRPPTPDRDARRLAEPEAVPHIRDLLARESGGKGRVILVPRLDSAHSVEIALPGGFNVLAPGSGAESAARG